MHDTDNDGMITLEEYRHVSPCSDMKCCLRSSFQSEVDVTGLLSIDIQIISHLKASVRQVKVNSNYQN